MAASRFGTLLADHQGDGAATTQDFSLTSTPTAPAASSQQFVDFMKAFVDATVAADTSRLGSIKTFLERGAVRKGAPRLLFHDPAPAMG